MKMRRKLTAEEREDIEQAAEILRKAIAQIGREVKTRDSLLGRLEKLKANLPKLEKKAEAGDEKASMELAASADQQRRLSLSIERSENEVEELSRQMPSIINDVQNLIASICDEDLRQQLHKACAAAMAPFCHHPPAGKTYAFYTDASHELSRFLNPVLLGRPGESDPSAAQQLATLERLLAGEEIWSFTPNPQHPSPAAAQ